MKIFKPALILTLICSSLCLHAQSTSTGIGPGLIFQRFDSRHGLPDVRVRNLFQDSKGYLWIGTMNGTARYDGYQFQKYIKRNDSNSISGNWAYSICEDKSGNLWFGTKDGLNCLDANTQHFRTYRSDTKGNPLVSNVITAVYATSSGLWIGTDKGLLIYNDEKHQFKRLKNAPFNQAIACIISAGDNYLWIATQQGVIHYNLQTAEHHFYKISLKPNPYGDRFWCMLQVEKDLYLGTAGDGLVKLPYHEQSDSYGHFQYLNTFKNSRENLNETQIFDMCKSHSGDLWLATERGLAKVKSPGSPDAELRFYRNNPISNKSISSNIVYRILIDRNNILWCGTESGLNKLNLNLLSFHYYTFSDKNIKDQVRAIYAPDQNNIWVGTANTGLFRYNANTGGTEQLNNTENRISKNSRTLIADGNSLLLGTLTGGLKIDPFSKSAKQMISGKAVFCFLKDQQGNTWIGTNKGLYRITMQNQLIDYASLANAPDPLKSGFIRSIYQDHQGRLWLGFENGGIGVYQPQENIYTPVQTDAKNNRISGRNFFCLIEFPQNTIWAGSESGLNQISIKGNKLNPENLNIRTYLEKDGLPDQSVNSIMPDQDGNIWMGTIKGLSRLNPANGKFRSYLSELEFLPGSYYHAEKNQLYFGANDGFVRFNPREIADDHAPPRTVFNDFKLFNKSVNLHQQYNGQTILKKHISENQIIKLNYLNNVFTIGFAGLHFSDPSQNNYAYKMEGFDKEWIHTDAANRNATYTNLDPGNYHFKVKAANYAGKWQEKPIELQITMLPPPWKTWWAITLYILLFNVLLLIFYRYLIIQNKQRSQIRFVQKEKQQMENLHQMKLNFFTDISHEFRTPLSLIVSPVEEILATEQFAGKTRQKMEIVFRNCKKLLYLVEELMTFQKMEQGMLQLNTQPIDIVSLAKAIFSNFQNLAEKQHIHFNFSSNIEQLPIILDPGKIEMAINNLLFNAFKFTPQQGYINLNLMFSPAPHATENQSLRIVVQDNGKGISAEESSQLFQRFYSGNQLEGTGIGLSLTKRIIELHKGKIEVDSELGEQTTFCIILPVSATDLQLQDSPLDYQPDTNDWISLPELPDFNPSAENPATNKYSLLLVDDNPEILDYLELLLQDKYLISRAQNGRSALQQLTENQPDLIISDVMMPEMDGVEFCAAVKSNIESSHIPMILLSAKSTLADQLDGLKTGADDYIAKPFHPQHLLVKVEKLIEAQQKLIARYRNSTVIIPENISVNPLDQEFLQKVITLIEKNLNNDSFGVEQLGELVFMSRSHLFRKLKAITGNNPLELIYGIRLKHAMKLLLERRHNISEIAYEVGFKNPSSFTAAFKKQYGKTPSDYLSIAISAEKKHLP